MNDELATQIAQSLDATPELLPFIPELLADTWTLGSDPQNVLDLLRPLGLGGRTTRMLDVGCGKGAVAVTLARELGWRACGVDGFEPFIQEAKARAKEDGVGHLCEFQCADMRETVRTARGYDVVVYAGHVSMIDDRPCVEVLRRCVRPGGYIVVDDGYLADSVRSKPPGYEDYLPHDQTIRRLTENGDTLVREMLLSADDRDGLDLVILDGIRRRAADLARRRPDVADMVSWYVENQQRERKILKEIYAPAVWLLQVQGRQDSPKSA